MSNLFPEVDPEILFESSKNPNYNPIFLYTHDINLKDPVKTYWKEYFGSRLVNLFIKEAEIMYRELKNSKKDKGGKIKNKINPESACKLRLAESNNPKWYKDLRHNYGYERDRVIACIRNGREYKKNIKEKMRIRKGGEVSYYKTSHVNKLPAIRSLERISKLEDYGLPHPVKFRIVPYDYEMRKIIFDRLTFDGYDEVYCCRIFPEIVLMKYDKSTDDIPF